MDLDESPSSQTHETISAWVHHTFAMDPAEFRRPYLAHPLHEDYGITVAGGGDCLGEFVCHLDGLFVEMRATPHDGDVVWVLWRESVRAAHIRDSGTPLGLKFWKVVDGTPWLVCNYGFVPVREGDQILGVVRAIRTPPTR